MARAATTVISGWHVSRYNIMDIENRVGNMYESGGEYGRMCGEDRKHGPRLEFDVETLQSMQRHGLLAKVSSTCNS